MQDTAAATIITILGLLAAVTGLSLAARRVNIPYPTIMVVGGLAIALIPGLPAVPLPPDVVFLLFLPPLLYAGAWQTDWREFRANLRPITLLAVGFTLFTTVVLAGAVHWLVPGMPWAAAFAFGAIISPPDAVAATAIASRLGVPRRVVTVLEGESLVNDATGLALYRYATAAVVTGSFSLLHASGAFLWGVVGGIALGLVLGYLATLAHRLLEDPQVETIITLLTPFAAFVLGEAMHASGVLAVVTAGLFVSRQASRLFSPETRMQAVGFWRMLIFIMNSMVFILIGLQLKTVVHNIKMGVSGSPEHLWVISLYAVILSVIAIVARIIWVFPGAYVPRLIPAVRRREPNPPWGHVFIIAYTGMRGVDSLAAALALPEKTAAGDPFPRRSLIIFLSFGIILFTLVVQSATLPAIIRWLKIRPEASDACDETEARRRALRAALAEIDNQFKAPDADASHLLTLENLRERYNERLARLSPDGNPDSQTCVEPDETEDIVHRQLIAVERQTLIDLRDQNIINDEILHRVERDLDLEDLRLA